jgi:hypothetical protein
MAKIRKRVEKEYIDVSRGENHETRSEFLRDLCSGWRQATSFQQVTAAALETLEVDEHVH